MGFPERLLPPLSILLLGTPRSDSTPDPEGEALAGMVSENLAGTWSPMTTEHLHETRLPASQCWSWRQTQVSSPRIIPPSSSPAAAKSNLDSHVGT